MPIKLAMVDDHPVVTNGLQKIFVDFPQIKVVGIYRNGEDLLQELKTQQPDVLLLDMHLPGIQGPELATAVLKILPSIKIIVLSSSDILFQVKKMLQVGCVGYLLKESDDLTIVKAIETVYNGEKFLSPILQQRIVNDAFKAKPDTKQVTLTRREKEILVLIVKEFTNQEIADQLFLSPHTIDNHRISLLHKLGVKNTAGLVRVAMETGLV